MAILGIDEVGRGPWAGPLVVGAVILNPKITNYTENPTELWQDELTDSKKLTEKKREKLVPIIEEKSVATGLGWVSAKELDKVGLANALKLATNRAVENISTNLFSEIIIDGTTNFLKNTPLENLVTTLPKADLKIKEVSAASIIAKVARDNYMKNLSEKYPEYGFEKHVGYGTAFHKAALEKYGPCPEHRTSFKPIKKISPTTEKGNYAEQIVADFLKTKSHKILARNYKTKFYEIDIVSATKSHIYFTEVKYRKTSSYGTPLEFIDHKKQTQMEFAAKCFMRNLAKKLNRSESSLPSPILAAASVSGTEFTLDKWLELTL